MKRSMKIMIPLILFILFLFPCYCFADNVLEPVCNVPSYVPLLIEVASEEVGYREEEHGKSKYGEWAGDPYCQWCAEFICWCVDQTDQRYGTALLNNVYPCYSGSNSGRNWFIRAGRYAIRKGKVDGWGYEWLKGKSEYLKSGSYVPQPGDLVFFTWTGSTDTDHVALVEYCTINSKKEINVHVIEGNNPVAVARNVYSIHDKRILGYGTANDLVDITMRFGNNGEKVRCLQEKLYLTGYLEEQYITGNFGNATVEAVRKFQSDHRQRASGIATLEMQTGLEHEVDIVIDNDPNTWTVIDE